MNHTNISRCDFKITNDSFQIGYIGIPFSCCVFCQNVLVALTVWHTQALHTSANIMIASVSICDGIMTLIWIFHEYLHFPQQHFDYGTIIMLDTFLLGASYATVMSSCTHMVIIAIDRYIHIAHPFYYMKNMTRCRLLKTLTAAWIVWLTFLLIPFLAYRNEKYHAMCITFMPPLEFYIPCAVITITYYIISFVCYFKIARVAFDHKQSTHARRLQCQNLEIESTIKNNHMAAMRSVKFFTIMFGTFFICTLPQIFSFGLKYSSLKIPTNFFCSLLYVYEIHSFLNFINNMYMNKAFSKGLRSLIKPQRVSRKR